MKKRLLIISLLLFCLVVLGIPITFTQPGIAQTGLPNQVAAGDVTQTSAVLWARSQSAGLVTFEYALDANFIMVVGQAQAFVTEPLQPVKVSITGLTPNTTYYYRATDATGASSRGRFRTPAAIGTRLGLRFGVSGDWRGDLAPYPSVRNAAELDLAFFVALGDTIYSDYPSPDVPLSQARTLEEFRRKHNEVYSTRTGLNTLGDLRASTAILAMIDDHEVTNDFAGGASPSSDPRFPDMVQFINDTELYENGLQAFQEYNPINDVFYGDTSDPRTANERKLYRAITYGSDAAVFLLDARSFRDEPLEPVRDITNQDEVRQFLVAAFNPARTMLSRVQLEELKADLLRAHLSGITWKFVIVPEPIQNFGPLAAEDRFEGYAAERNELLAFIHTNNIKNVVFIAADIHGTVVNNLTYQTHVGGPQIPTSAWEITTGAVAFDAPFGPTVVALAAQAGLLTEAQVNAYRALPRRLRDAFLKELMDAVIEGYGYDKTGLEGSGIDARLVTGGYVAVHTYGWTEFRIDAASQQLRVITYGIDPYTPGQAASAANRRPSVVSEFTVNPRN